MEPRYIIHVLMITTGRNLVSVSPTMERRFSSVKCTQCLLVVLLLREAYANNITENNSTGNNSTGDNDKEDGEFILHVYTCTNNILPSHMYINTAKQ